MVVHPSSKFNAALSWLKTPNKFYVQPLCMLEGLDELMNTIENLCPEKMNPMKSVDFGQPCLAKFLGSWYRGKVGFFIKCVFFFLHLQIPGDELHK